MEYISICVVVCFFALLSNLCCLPVIDLETILLDLYLSIFLNVNVMIMCFKFQIPFFIAAMNSD